MKVRSKILLVSSLVTSFFLVGCNACTEQHDPRQHREQIEEESRTANRPITRLNEDGTYPEVQEAEAAPTQTAATTNPAEQKYQMYCAACHGQDGRGDSPTAQAMNPRPRDLSSPAWQDSVDDDHIRTVIRDGGTAVGLSAAMTAWGNLLSEEELEQMVQLVRGFGN